MHIKHNTIIILLFGIFSSIYVYGQSLADYKLVTSDGQVNLADSYTEESTGATYLIGPLNNTITFRRWGSDVIIIDDPTTRDFFFAVANSEVEYIRRISVMSTSNNNFITRLAVTQSYVYVLGSYDGTLQVYDEDGNLMTDDNFINQRTSNGSTDGYLLKFNKSNGSLAGIYSFGSEGTDYGDFITTDRDGNILVGGRFQGTMNFQLIPSFWGNVIHASNGADLFIAKYEPNNFDRLNDFVPIGDSEDQLKIWSIEVNNNNEIFVAGRFHRSINIPSLSESFVLSTPNTGQTFFSKLNSSLEPQWLKLLETNFTTTVIGDLTYDEANALLFATGRIKGSPQYDGTNLEGNFENDNILSLKINAEDGSLYRANIFGNDLLQDGKEIAVDHLGNYFITGTFENELTINSNNISKSITGGSRNAFLAVFNRNDDIMYLNKFTSSIEVLASQSLILNLVGESQLSLQVPLVYSADLEDVDLGEGVLSIPNTSGAYDSYIGNYIFSGIPTIISGNLDSDGDTQDIFYVYRVFGVNLGSATDYKATLIEVNNPSNRTELNPSYIDGEELYLNGLDDIVAGVLYRIVLDKQEYKDIYSFSNFSVAPDIHYLTIPTFEVVPEDNFSIPGRYFGSVKNNVQVFLIRQDDNGDDVGAEVPTEINSVAPDVISIKVPTIYPGNYSMKVIVNGSENPDGFLKILPKITAIDATDNVPGGKMVIEGAKFIDETHQQDKLEIMLFSGTQDTIRINTFTSAEENRVEVSLPDDLTEGTYQVEVLADGFASAQQNLAIEDRPIVKTQTVTGAPGGEFVITGLNLDADNADIQIDEQPAEIISKNETEIIAIIPEMEPGTYPVTLNWKNSSYPLDEFTLTSVSIVSVEINIETYELTASGSNFGLIHTLAIGETDAEFTITDDQTLEIIIPEALFPGYYPIRVSLEEGGSFVVYDSLKIEHTISDLSPEEVYVSSEIKITGNNFRSATDNIEVYVGEKTEAVEGVTVNDEGTEITFEFLVDKDDYRLSYPVQVVVNGIEMAAGSLQVKEDITPPELSLTHMDYASYTQGFSLSFQAADPETDVDTLEIAYAGIMADTYGEFQSLQEGEFSFSPANGDELGIKYLIRAVNKVGKDTISEGKTYWSYLLTAKSAFKHKSFKTDPQQTDYRIVALPFEQQSVTSALESVASDSYDKKEWRLFRRNPSKSEKNGYEELNEVGFTSFEPGRGYWLLAKDDVLSQVQGNVAKPNEEGYISVPVSDSWNMIGNPYPFAIDWDEVVRANPEISFGNQAMLKTYRESYKDEANKLEAYEGAFVEINGSGVLKIPFSSKLDVNARQLHTKNEAKETQVSLHAPNWQVVLSVQVTQDIRQELKLGMHQKARFEKDFYDASVFPSFFFQSAASFTRDDDALETDILPPAGFAEWSIALSEASKDKVVTMQWNSERWHTDQYQLWLYNEKEKQVVDMLSRQSYSFLNKGEQAGLKVLYGTEQDLLAYVLPEKLHVGKVFPNPASQNINLPLMVPVGESSPISWQLYEMSGQVINGGELNLETGIHQAVMEVAVKPGFYILKLLSAQGETLSYQKVILK